MRNQGDVIGSTWICNFQPKRRRYVTRTSDDVRQASLCTRPMAKQIWVLVQARYHLLAETLCRIVIGPDCQSPSWLELDSQWKSPFFTLFSSGIQGDGRVMLAKNTTRPWFLTMLPAGQSEYAPQVALQRFELTAGSRRALISTPECRSVSYYVIKR